MTRHSHPIASPDDQKVTFVELFFDLVFVYCVTQVVTLLHGHIDWRSAGSAVLVFWLVWWAWTQFTWALNAANTEHPRIQVITLLATAVAFLLAVGIPGALGRDALDQIRRTGWGLIAVAGNHLSFLACGSVETL